MVVVVERSSTRRIPFCGFMLHDKKKTTPVVFWFCQSAGLIVGELKAPVVKHRQKLDDMLNENVLMEKVPFPPVSVEAVTFAFLNKQYLFAFCGHSVGTEITQVHYRFLLYYGFKAQDFSRKRTA